MSELRDIIQGTQRRVARFATTSPDDAHNRRRLIFLLIIFFFACILTKLTFGKDENTLGLVNNFTSTIIWLVGIYVGGSVAAQAVGGPQVTETPAGPPAANPPAPAR
jgi:hypothetical protein